MQRKITTSAILALLSLGLYLPSAQAGNWSSCTEWASKKVGYYGVRNNVWGWYQSGYSWQCMWASWGTNWIAFGADAGHSNGNGGVKGYPQIIRGWSRDDGFALSDNHGLGIKVKDLTEAKVRWKFTSPNSGRHISLIDIYLHWWHTPGRSTLPACNLQIYTHVQENESYLTDESNIQAYYRGKRTIGGIEYKAWVTRDHPDGDLAADWLFHVRPTSWRRDATHDVKGILDWGVELGIINKDNMYLTSIQAGWELIEGGSGFNTNSYWTRVNGY